MNKYERIQSAFMYLTRIQELHMFPNVYYETDIETAVACIKKQMPIKPKPIQIATLNNTPEQVSWTTGEACPVCNGTLTTEWFCPYCGQALDRNESND